MTEHSIPVAFRAGVGAVVIDAAGLVLAGERTGRAGAWQLPQGGIEPGEEPSDALWRELAEETGLRAEEVDVVAEHPEWLAYELPPELRRPHLGRGQVQRWWLLRLRGPAAALDFARATDREFDAWRWMRMEELAAETAPFRRGVYQRLLAEFARHLA